MSEILAAVGRVQLKHLPEWIERRREVAEWYNSQLDTSNITLPIEKEWAKHAYHLYVIRCNNRDRLREFLKEKDIATGVHYPLPVHLQPPIKDAVGVISLPFTEKIAKEVLSVPMHPQMSQEDVQYATEIINKWGRK